MRAAWASLLVVMACSFRPVEDAPDANEAAPWLAGYDYRKVVTISSGMHDTLSAFPVGIVLKGDAQLALHDKAGGKDIVITDADGTTQLARELVAFDPDTGALELWVRVPTLVAGTQLLYLYYGGANDTTTATAVWSGFAAVWHMTDLDDSTNNNHTLAATGAPPRQSDGIAGAACTFNGGQPLTTSPGGLDFATASFSFSLWVDLGTDPSGYVEPLFHGGTSPGHPGYSMLLGEQRVVKISDTAGIARDALFSTTKLVDSWHQLVGVVDRQAQTITAYTDGARTGDDTISDIGSLAGSDGPALGRTDGAAFTGTIDEVRVYGGVLSPDWIAAEFHDLKDATFAAVGDESSR